MIIFLYWRSKKWQLIASPSNALFSTRLPDGRALVFAVDGKRHVSTRFMAWELTPSREDALATITSIDDLPKFVEDMSAQYQKNPIIPFVPHELIQQLGAMASQR